MWQKSTRRARHSFSKANTVTCDGHFLLSGVGSLFQVDKDSSPAPVNICSSLNHLDRESVQTLRYKADSLRSVLGCESVSLTTNWSGCSSSPFLKIQVPCGVNIRMYSGIHFSGLSPTIKLFFKRLPDIHRPRPPRCAAGQRAPLVFEYLLFCCFRCTPAYRGALLTRNRPPP